jgi:hypothetical protein
MRRPAALPLLLVLLAAAPVAAQRPTPPLATRAEFRIAVPLTPAAGVEAGVGAEIRAGWYARVGAGITAGTVRSANEWEAVQHAALTARFLFDPYGERRFGLYGGAGLGIGLADGRSSRGELLVLAGVEGAARGRFIPALEVVLGGGVRVQGVLRLRRDAGR